MPLFTVFTPTYNRAHLLHRVHSCLTAQTFRDFEWLIVDDGSTDETGKIVANWQAQADFPIRYIWQENGHKKKAFNRAVKEAHGELLLPWDSDDEAVPEALAFFRQHWLAIPQEQRDSFVGVCALCKDEHGKLVGSRFPADTFDSDSLEVRYRYGVSGEKWGFSRTDVLRLFPFPEDVQGHVPEGIVWSAIARRYKTRFINQVLRIYHQASDSITETGHHRGGAARHCEGHVFWARAVLENELRWFRYRPTWFLKMAANHTRFALHLADMQPGKHYALRDWRAELIRLLLWPVGYALYLRDKAR
jgi:glycosyltransferase involved in cell wall biosynthesis